jgi:hypothetical protein
MAYADAPFGFIPVRHKNGSPWNGALELGWVDSSDSTAIFPGDPVIVDGTANTAEVEALGHGKKAPGMVKGYTRATAGTGNRISGVCVAVAASDRDSTTYRAASTERLIMVCTDPSAVFRVQADAAVAVADVGRNTNILFDTAGSTSTGRSGAEVDATTAAGATNQCVIEGFWDDPENEPNAVGNQVLVSFGLHTQSVAGGIVGV